MDSSAWRGFSDTESTSDSCRETSSEVDRSEAVDESRRWGTRMAEYFQMHRTFFVNFRLSLVVGVVVALACMPSYAVRQNSWLFGQNAQVVEALTKGFDPETRKAVWERWHCEHFVSCSPNDANRMYNVAPICDPPQLVPFNKSLSDWDPSVNSRDLWCGVIPERYAALWPNVGQFIVFTVDRDTGSTVRLAWQGLVGTTAAAVNMWLIYLLFGFGWQEGADCRIVEATIILWSLAVIFLFLFSRVALNTKKFGMSWYISLVMNYLNPEYVWSDHWGWRLDGYVFVVLVTTVFGALLSVLATVLPFPLLSIRRLREDVQDVVKAIDQIWEEALHYFLGVEGPSAVWRLLKRTEELRIRHSGVAANFDASWWECFDLCGTRRSRKRMRDCLNAMTDVRDLMYTVNRGLRNTRCDAQHDEFVQELGAELKALKATASALMTCCVASCMDGIIDQDERWRLHLQFRLYNLANFQEALVSKYRSLGWKRQLTLSEPCVFAFFLSYWARRIAAYTERVVREETPKPLRKRCAESFRHLMRSMLHGFKEVWSLPKIIDRENKYDNLKFALRAFIPIAAVFLLTTCSPTTRFYDQYDATMANTLVFLIFPSDRVEPEKGAHRFLAVALGRLVPMMIVRILNILGCGNWLRFFAQFGAVVLFTSSFLYVYYTSQQWSYLGCLIAGFGVVPLLCLCDDTGSTLEFADRYKALAEVCLALTIHFVVGWLLRTMTPDNLLCIELRQLTDELVAGFSSYFSGKLSDVAEHAAHASRLLASCQARAPQCDPKLAIAPLLAAPFKLELAQSALKHLQLVVSDLDMLVVALQGLGLGAPEHEVMASCAGKTPASTSDSEDEAGGLGEDRLPTPAAFPPRTPASTNDSEDEGGGLGEDRLPAPEPCTPRHPDQLLVFIKKRPLGLQAARDDFLGLMKEVFAAFLAILEHRLEVPCPPEHMRALERLDDTAAENPMSPERLRQRVLKMEKVNEDEGYAGLTGELGARIAVCVRAVADATIRLHHIKDACLKEDIY